MKKTYIYNDTDNNNTVYRRNFYKPNNTHELINIKYT